MKRIVLLLVLLIASVALFAGEPVKGIGVGVSTGLPFHAGAMGEYNFGPAYASVELAYASGPYFLFRVGGGYNFPEPFVNDAWGMDLRLSVGGRFSGYIGSFGGSVVASGAFSIPVTWSWYADGIPLKVFVQAGPDLYFGGGAMQLDFSGTAGVMYVFSLEPKQGDIGD
ncbi:MAG: hypothetical protein GX911_02275 [Spirochaetales bacterium]|nr:hypothetical protein [Spirochaetales bacterium]